MATKVDIAIIGAGVVGCSIARWLTQTNANVLVIEARNDVACGASRANSAIVHAGFDAHPGTLMSRLNVKGNAMYDEMCTQLSVPLIRNGSLVLAFEQEDLAHLEKLRKQGTEAGVPGLEILSKEEVLKREPLLNPELIAALWAPTGAITCPYKLTSALAENAIANGAQFMLGHAVNSLSQQQDGWEIGLEDGSSVTAAVVINAAGVYADEISRMAGAEDYTLVPRRGEYMLLDRSEGTMVSSTIFQSPTRMGKGVLVTPTVDGNLLVGPTALDQEDKRDVSISAEGLGEVAQKSRLSLPGIRLNRMITGFTGIRAIPDPYDFRIETSDVVPGFVQVAGICSPGLSSAPAIAEMVLGLVRDLLPLSDNEEYNPTRFEAKPFMEMNWEERRQAVAEDPAYGQIICRCETVTEAEIVRAIHSAIPATSLDAVKRRTRAGMGRCQGGFCSPKVMEIIARETGLSFNQINKGEPGSWLVCGYLKDREEAELAQAERGTK